jgi:hypothetical protein
MTMKMTAKFIDRYPMSAAEYWELEGSVREQNKEQQSLISRIFQAIVAKLSASNEPRIRLRYSPAGRESWHVYDPTTGKANVFMSEADVRVWLEERYYG